jgi:Fic family protein
MGQDAPHYQPASPSGRLEKLPPLRDKVETIEILRQTNKSTAALAELKGIAKTIPNQAMLINAIVLQEAKDSSEIENIITTQKAWKFQKHWKRNSSLPNRSQNWLE